MKVITTSDKEHAEQVKQKLKENNYYCPCVPDFAQNEDTKCMCKKFRESKAGTTCHCGLYIKVVE